jgi:hypothetical protein
MAGAFQNYLHAMYGLPGGLVSNNDRSDILDTYRKKKKLEDLEEEMALRILKARHQEDIVLEPEVDKNKLIKVLKGKIEKGKHSDEVTKRVKLIITILAFDD